MHELTRRAYLTSMGIDSYVSRAQLLGAAPTKRLVVVPRAAPADQAIVKEVPPQAAALALDTTTNKATSTDPAIGKSGRSGETPRQPAAIPSFSIVAIACGGWLWLEELSNPEISGHQVQLIRSMVRALGLDDKSVDVSQFNWPIHRNAQLDLGEDAARAGLGGFVNRKAEQHQCGGLILLGSPCQQKLDANTVGPGRCVSTFSTAQMLLDPFLKKRAWLDLLAISSRS